MFMGSLFKIKMEIQLSINSRTDKFWYIKKKWNSILKRKTNCHRQQHGLVSNIILNKTIQAQRKIFFLHEAQKWALTNPSTAIYVQQLPNLWILGAGGQ